MKWGHHVSWALIRQKTTTTTADADCTHNTPTHPHTHTHSEQDPRLCNVDIPPPLLPCYCSACAQTRALGLLAPDRAHQVLWVMQVQRQRQRHSAMYRPH